MKKGIADPRDAMTLPYLVPQITVPVSPRLRDAATMTFSIIAFDMPMALMGYTALSVLRQTTELTPMIVNWGLSETLCYLRYLELRDGARRIEDEDPERWALVA